MVLAPYPVLGVVAAFLLVIDYLAIATLDASPWPGFELVVEGDRVVVAESVSSVPDETVVEAFLSSTGRFDVYPVDLIEEPDMLDSLEEMVYFFERQARLSEVLNGEDLRVVPTVGPAWDIELKDAAGRDRPLMFGLQLLVGNIGMLVGTAVWVFQRHNPAARHLLFTGIGLAAAAVSAAIYSSRPVALDGVLFRSLSYTNMLGTLFFAAAFVSMMWYYPKALNRFRIAALCYALIPLVIAADWFQWVPSMDYTRRLPPVIALLAAATILFLQWRRTSTDLVARQSLKWFIIVTLSGSTFFVVAVLIPAVFGMSPAVSQGAGFVGFLTIYIGLAVGVSRYPLFDLDRYWITALYWATAGLMLIGVDLLVISVFSMSERDALWLSIAVLGWLYFPVRTIASRYLMAPRSFEHYLPTIVTNIASSQDAEINDVWMRQIRALFQPLELRREDFSVATPMVVKQGLGMVLPPVEGTGCLSVTYADQGRRLFTSDDAELIAALRKLYELANNARTARLDGVRQERERIKRDIHDALGGRLLTILHRAEDQSIVAETRQALGELRDILAAVEDQETPLTATIEKWYVQASTQADAFDCELVWHVSEQLYEIDWRLGGSARLSLGRIISEATTNALRHAGARHLEVRFDYDGERLVLTVANDGEYGDPDEWVAGHGLVNMRERAIELGGNVSWSVVSDRRTQFEFSMPLGVSLPANVRDVYMHS